MNHRSLLCLLAVGILVAGIPAERLQALETIYLVRHADKVDFWPADRSVGAFRPLSRTGVERADRLVEHLRDAGIAAIYTSSTTRTLATGMPLAEATGVDIGTDDRSIARPQLAAFFADLKTTHREDTAALIVGHSNTTPWLLIELGAEEACFDRLDIHDHEGELLIHGYEGLWRVDLKTPGCAGIERQIVTLGSTAEGE